MYVLFVLISFRAGHCACKNTAKLTHTVQYSELDGYPSHSPKWRIRPPTLSSTLIDTHPNFKQLRRMCANRNSSSSSISGSHNTSCGCHLDVTWPSRSSNHTSSLSFSWSTWIDVSSTLVVSPPVTPILRIRQVVPARGDARCSARHLDVQSLISAVLVSIARRQ
jgi:hypothetical protein